MYARPVRETPPARRRRHGGTRPPPAESHEAGPGTHQDRARATRGRGVGGSCCRFRNWPEGPRGRQDRQLASCCAGCGLLAAWP
jgi:hypothetical protein